MGLESYPKSLITPKFFSLYLKAHLGMEDSLVKLKDPSTDHMQTFSHLNQNLSLLYYDKGLLTWASPNFQAYTLGLLPSILQSIYFQ